MSILEFLHACYGDLTGRAHAATGRHPYLTDAGKYRHKDWLENDCGWPGDAELLAQALAHAGAEADVYVCPYLMWSDKRTPGGVVARILVHADVDGGHSDPEKIQVLGGFALASGTPGHVQVFIPLSERLPANQHKVLQRALVAHFGADAKISANDVLRLPGTLNFKPTVSTPGADPAPVTWLVRPNGERVDPHTLAAQLGVTLPSAGADNGAELPFTATASVATEVGEPVDLAGYPRVLDALAHVTGDRSEDIARVVGACFDAVLTRPQTRWVVSIRTDLTGKLAELSHDDVGRLWDKYDKERRTAAQQGFWSSGGTGPFSGTEPVDEQATSESGRGSPVYAEGLLTRSDLRDLPDPQPLIHNTLDQSSVALLYGHRGTLKTFIALDWALSVSTGRAWQHRNTEQRRTLYVAAEGAFGFKGRVAAWETGWHTNISDGDFSMLPRPVNLTTNADVNNLGALIDWGGYSFIVLDTLARCMVGADENSAKDIGVVVDRLYWLLDKTPGRRGVVLGVHHTGKDAKTLRGSSAFEAGVDTVYSVTRDEAVTLNREKRKDGPEPDHHDLKLDLIEGTGSGVIGAVNLSTWGVEKPARAGTLLATFLQHFATTGATKTELKNVANMTDGTFYRALSDLLTFGDLINEGTDKRPHYKAAGG